MKVINLFAGPGAGKSTTAAAVYAELKARGYNAELAREWPKGVVWDGYLNALEDQVYILGKHYRELARFKRGGVEVVVSDSPLLLGLVYSNEGPNFTRYTMELHERFDNMNFFVQRQRPYNPRGRVQSQPEARLLDGNIRRLLSEYAVIEVPGDARAVHIICDKFPRRAHLDTCICRECRDQ